MSMGVCVPRRLTSGSLKRLKCMANTAPASVLSNASAHSTDGYSSFFASCVRGKEGIRKGRYEMIFPRSTMLRGKIYTFSILVCIANNLANTALSEHHLFSVCFEVCLYAFAPSFPHTVAENIENDKNDACKYITHISHKEQAVINGM